MWLFFVNIPTWQSIRSPTSILGSNVNHYGQFYHVNLPLLFGDPPYFTLFNREQHITCKVLQNCILHIRCPLISYLINYNCPFTKAKFQWIFAPNKDLNGVILGIQVLHLVPNLHMLLIPITMMFSICILHVKHSHKIPKAIGGQLIFVVVLIKKKMDIMPKLLKSGWDLMPIRTLILHLLGHV